MKANKIIFGFFGGCWCAYESIETPNYEDPETGDAREYARIYPNGEVRPGKWWGVLSAAQKLKIEEAAKGM